VVDENPLAFATSRIVTMEALPLACETLACETLECRTARILKDLSLTLEFKAEVGGHYSRK
jgi:hypothetical protein